MKGKRILSLVLAMAMVLGTMGTVAFAEETVVAKIGQTPYATLAAAIEAASVGAEIDLCANVVQIPQITKAITIDGNNNHVTAKADEKQFGVIDGTVTLKNLVFDNGTEAIRTDYGNYGGETDDYVNLNLVIENCSFNAVTNYVIMGGQSADKKLGALTVTGCVFNADIESGCNNYMVYAQQVGKLTITGCTFNGNSVTKGAIHTGDSTKTVTVATISGNTISGVQRGVQIGNRVEGSSVTVTNNTFSNITAEDGKTGAVYVHEVADSNVNVKMTENIATTTTNLIYNDKNTDIAQIVTEATGNTSDGAGVTITFGADGTITESIPVAKIGETSYETLAAALAAAKDGESIELISGDSPISAAGAVYGKTVTITGAAVFDWSKGWLFVGRGGEGNGTVIFDNANITSASNSSSYGIHVSGREKETDSKYDGTLVIKDSTLELDYLINRGSINVDNSTLTVKNGFGIAGRPASETESGKAATATINITNKSYVKVLNHNGMGVGVASHINEGYGVLNLIDSTFESASFNINDTELDDVSLGDFNVSGESTLKIDTLTGKEIDLQHNATITDSTVGGEVMLYGKVTFSGDNTFAMLYDYGNAYSTDYAEWIIEDGASVTLTEKARYGLGYGDKLTIYGNIEDALTARETLTEDDISLFTHGLVAMSNWNVPNFLNVKDAYVVIGSNNSFGNSRKHTGTYDIDFENAVVDASRITFYEAASTTTFNITGSDFKVGTFMTRDADSVFTLTNSKVVSTTTTNGTDEGNYNAGKLNLVNTDLVYSAPVINEGTGIITLDTNSSVTAPSISGAGTIEIDVTNYDGYSDLSKLIDADLTGFTGTLAVKGEAAQFEIENGKLVVKSVKPVGGPIIGYTAEDRIWGETRANAEESYVVKIYSGETFMGQSSLNNIDNIIDGDVTVTWNVKLNPTNGADEYWTTTWTIAPSMEYQPTHVALEVDGVEVNRTEIRLNGPDNLKKIHAAITDANGKILSYATTLESAFGKVKDGETVTLLSDVTLEKNIVVSKKNITFDGNGHTIRQAKGLTLKDYAAGLRFDGSSDDISAYNYTIKNVKFDGWTSRSVLAIHQCTATVDNVTINGTDWDKATQKMSYGLLYLENTEIKVLNSTFSNNNAEFVVTYNYGSPNSLSKLVIDNCTFSNNTVGLNAAAVYYVTGSGCTITNSDFTGNNITTGGNGATLYLGFMENCTVKNCLFKDNNVVSTGTSTRVAGAIFFGYDAEITGNVFENNTASNANGDKLGQHICTSTYYDCEIDLNNNYFDGEEPAEGDHYFIQHQDGEGTFNLKNYYREYSFDSEGNVVLSDLKPIVSKVVSVQYVVNENDSDVDEGLKVYDIVIVAEDEQLINRLNTADLTFAIDSDVVDYVITPAKDITLSNIAGTNRYMFNFDGKDNVADTALEIKIGQVRFTGFDSFVFNIADADTNLVSATTLDDNLVSYYDGTGLVINDGDENEDDDGYYGYIDTTINVPTRDLEINLDFYNAVNKNNAGYQNMEIVVSGGDLEKDIEIVLGNADVEQKLTMSCKPEAKYTVDTDTDNKYVVTVTGALTINDAYTVTVSGDGYRTARYTVTMTDAKTLNFWNNVMSEGNEVEIEVGKASTVTDKNFLAGDIVKDSQINIYDLSAVVSYFGTEGLSATNHPEYAKYDLNRDGVIDSKDVAYVLVSWGK